MATTTKLNSEARKQARQSLKDRGYIIPENRTYELKTNDGKKFGTVSYDAYNAIKNNALSSYTPKNTDEQRAIDNFKVHAEELQKKQTVKDIINNKSFGKQYVVNSTNKTEKNQPRNTTPDDPQYPNTQFISGDKVNKLNANPVTEKYGIDPNNFTMDDFAKWATEHNFEYRMAGNDLTGTEMKWMPKSKGGLKFWEVIPSKEEQADKKTLETLAKNNARQKTSQSDRGAVTAAVIGAIDGLTFGAAKAYSDWDAKRDYKKAGLNPDNFVGYKEAAAKTENEHKVASTLGNLAGSMPTFLFADGAVSGLLSKVPKYATIASEAAKGIKSAQKAKQAIDTVATVGLTTSASSALQQDWEKDPWYKAVGNTVLDTVTASAGAYLGGKISSRVGDGVVSVLKNHTKLKPKAIKVLASSGGALAFAGTTVGASEMKNAITCTANGTKYTPDVESIAANLVVMTLYGGLKTYARETWGTTNAPVSEEPFKYFTEEDMASPDALKKKMRAYTKEYHPDRYQSSGAEAVSEATKIFSEINAEYNRAKAACANNIMSDIKKAQTDNTEKTVNKNEAINKAVEFLNDVYADENTAVQPVTNISANTAVAVNPPIASAANPGTFPANAGNKETNAVPKTVNAAENTKPTENTPESASANAASRVSELIARRIGNRETANPKAVDTQGIFNQSFQFLSDPDSTINRNFVDQYANMYAKTMQGSGNVTYKQLEQATNGNVAGYLSDYAIHGRNGGNIVGDRFKNVLQYAADVQKRAHDMLYGENTKLSAQAEAIHSGDFSFLSDTDSSINTPKTESNPSANVSVGTDYS